MFDIHRLMLVARGDVLRLHQGGLGFFGKFIQVHKSEFVFANLMHIDLHAGALRGIGGKTRQISVAGLSSLSKLPNARVRFSHPALSVPRREWARQGTLGCHDGGAKLQSGPKRRLWFEIDGEGTKERSLSRSSPVLSGASLDRRHHPGHGHRRHGFLGARHFPADELVKLRAVQRLPREQLARHPLKLVAV